MQRLQSSVKEPHESAMGYQAVFRPLAYPRKVDHCMAFAVDTPVPNTRRVHTRRYQGCLVGRRKTSATLT